MSSYLPVSRGVPQGSVLGPYIIQSDRGPITRLAGNNESCLLMFADDKTLYASHRDPAKAAETVTKAFHLLGSTLAIEGLSVNAIKTVSMFIRPLRSQPLDTDIHISYRGAPLKKLSTRHAA